MFLRKKGVLEAQVLEADDGPIITSFKGKQLSQKSNCFHSFGFDAPEHDPGQVEIRAKYRDRAYGASAAFEYIQAPTRNSRNDGGNVGLFAKSPRGGSADRSAPNAEQQGGEDASESAEDSSYNNGSIAYDAYTGNVHSLMVKLSTSSRGIDNVDVNGMTALFWASFAGRNECVKVLLRYDANVHIMSKFGESALHAACYKGYDQIAKLLVRAGSKCNVQQNAGLTPIHIAAHFGHLSTLRALFGAVDCHATALSCIDQSGMTAEQHALLSDHLAVAFLIHSEIAVRKYIASLVRHVTLSDKPHPWLTSQSNKKDSLNEYCGSSQNFSSDSLLISTPLLCR
jgi:hypothetical protein